MWAFEPFGTIDSGLGRGYHSTDIWGYSMRLAVQLFLPALAGIWLVGCSCNRDDNVSPQPDPEETFNDIGSWLGMSVMPNGDPAVSYYDRTKGGLGFAIGKLGTESISWKIEEVDGYAGDDGLNPGDRGTHTDLVLTTDGTAHVSYRDETNSSLRYGKRSPDGTWEVGAGGSGSGAKADFGQWSSIALDAAESPVISFYDAGAEALRVSHATESGFSSEVIDEGGVGTYSDLLIVDGVEYIAYYDATNGDLKLAIGSAGAYDIEIVASEGDVGKWPSIAKNGDSFVIAYQDVEFNDLVVATGTPGAWTSELVDDSNYRGADNEVVFINDAPAVYTFDGYNNDLLLAEQTPDAWTIGKVAGDDAALGFHVEALNVGTDVYVASYDYTNRFLFFAIY